MELFRRRGNARGNASSLEEAGARSLEGWGRSYRGPPVCKSEEESD